MRSAGGMSTAIYAKWARSSSIIGGVQAAFAFQAIAGARPRAARPVARNRSTRAGTVSIARPASRIQSARSAANVSPRGPRLAIAIGSGPGLHGNAAPWVENSPAWSTTSPRRSLSTTSTHSDERAQRAPRRESHWAEDTAAARAEASHDAPGGKLGQRRERRRRGDRMAAVGIRHRAEQQHAARALGQRRQRDVQVAVGAFIGHQDRGRAERLGGRRELGQLGHRTNGMQPDAPVRLRQRHARAPRRPGAGARARGQGR